MVCSSRHNSTPNKTIKPDNQTCLETHNPHHKVKCKFEKHTQAETKKQKKNYGVMECYFKRLTPKRKKEE